MGFVFRNIHWFYALALISFFSPKMQWNNIFVIACGLPVLLNWIKTKKVDLKLIFNPLSLTFFLFFLSIVISSFYAPLRKEAGFAISKSLSLLFYPIIASGFLMVKKDKIKFLKKSFVVSNLVLLLSALTLSLVDIINHESIKIYSPETGVHVGYWFQGSYLSEQVEFHASYLSYYTLFSVLVVLGSPFKKVFLFNKQRSFLLVLLLLSFIILLNSVTLIITTFLILLLYLVVFFFNTKQGNKSVFVVGMLAGLFAFGSLGYYFVYKKTWGFNFSVNYEQEYHSSLSLRKAKWTLSKELIEESPIVGYGAGQAKSELLKKYHAVNFKAGINKKYDAHNQFLNTWIENGILGEITLVFLFIVGFYFCYKTKNWSLFTMLLMSLAFFNTECVLNKQRGVTFFSLVVPMLFFLESFREGKKTPFSLQ